MAGLVDGSAVAVWQRCARGAEEVLRGCAESVERDEPPARDVRRGAASATIAHGGGESGMGAIPWRSVIWDFNGTLIDDCALAVEAINLQLARRRLPPLSVDEYRRVFGFPLADYHQRIGFDLSAETMSGLADEFHGAYLAGLPSRQLHAGVRMLLERIAAAGARQFVLSAMEEATLREALARLGVDGRFDAIYGLDHRMADSKLARGRDLLERFRLSASATLLIGDTDHDVDVARELGIAAVLVARGHQSAERLRALGVPVYDTFADLERALFDRAPLADSEGRI
jgi:phosphoglycolate phosphatase